MSGPAAQRDVLDGLEERVAALEVVVVEEVRQARVTAGLKRPFASPATSCERDDRRRRGDERQRAERRRSARGRRRHQPAALEPVEQRPEQQADRDRRQEAARSAARRPTRPSACESQTSTVSAIVGEPRPEPEPSVARNSSRNAGVAAKEPEMSHRVRRLLRGGCRARSLERLGEEVVLLGGSDRDADRRRRPKPLSGRTITPSRNSASKTARASAPVSA